MNEIHSIGGQLIIDRSDRDPARQQDPYASRRQRQRHPRRDHPQAPDQPGPASEDTDTEPLTVGSRLNVRA